MPPTAASGSKIQLAQCVGHASLRKSADDLGGMMMWSRMMGLPNFQRVRPRKRPNMSVNSFVAVRFFIAPSKLQFEQADFERERFLHVRVEEPLGLFEHLQIFPRLLRGDPAGDFIGAGDLREMQQFLARREGV